MMVKATATRREPDAVEVAGRSNSLWRFAPIALILAGVSLIYVMGWHNYLTLSYLVDSRIVLKETVAGSPIAAPLLYLIVYVVAVAFSFPATAVLTIFAGFMFGWLVGGLIALIGATVGSALLFLAARSAFGNVLRDKVGGFSARLADGFREDAFVYMLVLRLAPFIPFVVVNIAPAFFNVRMRTYVAATAIGIVPGVFAYAWLGQGVDSVIVAAATAGRQVTLSDLVTQEITVAFSALALVALLAVVVRRVWSYRRR